MRSGGFRSRTARSGRAARAIRPPAHRSRNASAANAFRGSERDRRYGPDKGTTTQPRGGGAGAARRRRGAAAAPGGGPLARAYQLGPAQRAAP
eukprot:9211054-Pyramimonas_sp.AAC.1